MGDDKSDVGRLYAAVAISTDSYIEVEENEAIVKIKKKWPLVNQILANNAVLPVNQADKAT
ncbi:MAG: hypothetical protein M0Q44_18815 [Methylobacter sp.]|nr:hypothetical protein [Methylobacter sp.]